MPARRLLAPPNWYPRRGEVYFAGLDKARPAVIISVDGLNSYAFDVCIVPISTVQHRKFSLRPHIAAGEGGLKFDSWAKCDQVTTILRTSLQYPPLGHLTEATLRDIEDGIRTALGLLS